MFKHFFYTIFCLIISVELKSQKENIHFDHLSMKDGLSMNPVMAITQDAKGFLWVGTQDGLNKYDGYKFVVFKSEDGNKKSISDNFITSLCASDSGKLFIGTLHGLNVYDPAKNAFRQFVNTNVNLSSSKINCLSKDSGLILLGTEKGVSVFNPLKEEFVSINSKFKKFPKLSGYNVLCILKDKTGIYWFGTTTGLLTYNSNNNIFKKYESFKSRLSHSVILSLHEDAQGVLWVGTIEGLNRLEKNTDTFSSIYFKDHINDIASDKEKKSNSLNIYSIVNNYGGNTIRCMFEDDEGLLWIGTDMELVIYNSFIGKFINYKKDQLNTDGISDHFIRSMYMDRSRNLWIGTLSKGLNKTNLKAKKFLHYQKKIGDVNSISENYVRAICEDGTGTIWIGTVLGGLNKFNPSSESFRSYQKTKSNSPLSINDNTVWSVCYDKLLNGLWIGTNKGLDFLDLKNNVFTHYEHNELDKNSISDNTVRNIFIDSKNNLWCGTENGLNKLNREKKTFISYTPINSKLSNATVWKIIEDKNGFLWIATDDGLNSFDPSNVKFTTYKKNENDKSSISHNGIRNLFIDSDDNLWVGTQNGLNRFLRKTNSFLRFTTKDGLPNSFIYAISEDRNRRLWISTNKGISKFNKASLKFKNYDMLDGLQDLEFNTNACYYSSSGYMYFGGPNGLNVFNPLNFPINNYTAPVNFTNIKVSDKELLYSAACNIKKLDLDYKENNLFFEFSALDFTNPVRNKYSYMLKGFNKKWSNSNEIRFINYTNLNPGEYTFKVKGSNSDGVWNEQSSDIKIVIHPPFWSRLWFYIFCGILFLLLVYLYGRFRIHKLNKAKQLLEFKVKQRTAQVETQKTKLQQKNKDITDSIHYAKIIQNAILPDQAEFLSEFKDAFIWFKPRDIVSGDLFWLAKVTTTNAAMPAFLKIVVLADCTGHGVPGAFMSLMAIELLNQTIKNPDINSPSDLLAFINYKISVRLNKNNRGRVNDGMDMAVCAISGDNKKIYFAGALRPIWILRANHPREIEEIKGTKAPIGSYTPISQEFLTTEISVDIGDRIFLFTDGVTDQFGGENEKKFGKAKFKELILQSSKLKMNEQRDHIITAIANWQGKSDQVDDILIIGIEF